MTSIGNFIAILLFAIVINVVYILSYIFLVDHRKLRYYQRRIREWTMKRRMALATGNPKLLREVMRDAELIKKIHAEVFTEMIKPAMIVMILFLAITFLLKGIFEQKVLEFPFYIWFGGVRELNGFWCFALISFFINTITGSLLKLRYA